jgi:hypothetical protein
MASQVRLERGQHNITGWTESRCNLRLERGHSDITDEAVKFSMTHRRGWREVSMTSPSGLERGEHDITGETGERSV